MPVGGVTLLHEIKQAFRMRTFTRGMDKNKDTDKDNNKNKDQDKDNNKDKDEDNNLPSVVLIVGDCVISEGQSVIDSVTCFHSLTHFSTHP